MVLHLHCSDELHAQAAALARWLLVRNLHCSDELHAQAAALARWLLVRNALFHLSNFNWPL